MQIPGKLPPPALSGSTIFSASIVSVLFFRFATKTSWNLSLLYTGLGYQTVHLGVMYRGAYQIKQNSIKLNKETFCPPHIITGETAAFCMASMVSAIGIGKLTNQPLKGCAASCGFLLLTCQNYKLNKAIVLYRVSSNRKQLAKMQDPDLSRLNQITNSLDMLETLEYKTQKNFQEYAKKTLSNLFGEDKTRDEILQEVCMLPNRLGFEIFNQHISIKSELADEMESLINNNNALEEKERDD